MLEFVPYMGHELTHKEKQRITRILYDPSYHILNYIYNNKDHTQDSFITNIDGFMKEFSRAIEHPHHKIQVMGSVHENPSHMTGVICQVQHHIGGTALHPMYVSDHYVRFKFIRSLMYGGQFSELERADIHHFLVDVPTIKTYPLGLQFREVYVRGLSHYVDWQHIGLYRPASKLKYKLLL